MCKFIPQIKSTRVRAGMTCPDQPGLFESKGCVLGNLVLCRTSSPVETNLSLCLLRTASGLECLKMPTCSKETVYLIKSRSSRKLKMSTPIVSPMALSPRCRRKHKYWVLLVDHPIGLSPLLRRREGRYHVLWHTRGLRRVQAVDT